MKTNRLIWALGWVTMGSLAALQGCGGDDDDGGTGGKGGSGGKATGGSGGKATGGSSGTGGKATGGTAGNVTGGTSGTSGTSGAGGAPGGEGGMGGEGGAGDDMVRYAACTVYCQAYQDAQCFDAAADTYDNEPNCRDVCMEADWPIGTPGAANGDSIACRTTHAGLALAGAMMPDETHCGHASENPTGVCVD